jgi:hypothetical protein
VVVVVGGVVVVVDVVDVVVVVVVVVVVGSGTVVDVVVVVVVDIVVLVVDSSAGATARVGNCNAGSRGTSKSPVGRFTPLPEGTRLFTKFVSNFTPEMFATVEVHEPVTVCEYSVFTASPLRSFVEILPFNTTAPRALSTENTGNGFSILRVPRVEASSSE